MRTDRIHSSRHILTLAIALMLSCSTARAQTWQSAHARSVILPGSGSDVAHTITLEAPSLSSGLTLTFPASISNGGVLMTDGSGNLSWLTGVLVNPMTASGDIIFENSTPAPTRLAGNSSATKNFLTMTSSVPTWGTIAQADVSGLTIGSSPTFAGLSLSGTSNQIVLGSTNTTTLSAPAPSASRTYTLPDVGGDATIALISGTEAPGGVLYASSANAQSSSAAGTSGQFLLSGGTGAPTWGSAMSMVSGVSNGNFNDGASAFPMGMGPVANATISVTNENVMLITRSGTISNLYVAVPTTPASGKDYKLVIMKNGSASSVAADITNGNTTAQDTVNSLTVAAGDRISIKMTHSIAAATNGKALWAFELTYP
ncbi:MAG: hypothetical protein Q8922_01010 [Bacteroidota bacterium]|nr:hypothetical protein [Bacteroidota bacterium]MDP4232613.1 hypothetical protein [Bacteroidota bacterium]MDP4242933.1 hypothetical protein [Bacteroidota bacterium]MDP4286492.1 hypothetical protein [Bacteroidota bacterium]